VAEPEGAASKYTVVLGVAEEEGEPVAVEVAVAEEVEVVVAEEEAVEE